eukprot:gene402-1036_t
MDDEKLVWAPDTTDGFKLGKIVDIGTDNISVAPFDAKGKVIVAPYNRVFPAEDDVNHDVDDNCSLMYLNEATLLHNLKLRYKKDIIYTYVANILIAVNPYHEVKELYSKETILKYKGKSLGVLPPHVFAIADKTYRDMKTYKESQSLIVSGESGAGKTESTKYILRSLVETVGSGESGHIEKRIVEANPLLESFGNAKTLRNTNSSRFGKYVEMHFDEKAKISGAFISHYLLEKSRVCKQSKGERNYHVFYRMCSGAPDEMKKALKLSNTDSFRYLKGSLKDPNLDDVTDFKRMDQAMDAVGITMETKMDIYRIVAAVLHLGNVNFEENTKDKKGGSQVAESSEVVVRDVATLLGVEPDELKMSLATRIMTTTKGGGMGTLYKVPLKIEQACAGRDALAKAIYSKLFDHIVACVNQCFPYKTSESFIGVLDIAGFEFFEINSFEQFCINYCNEKLQQFFNERILKQEQELYDKEGLGVKTVTYVDNQDCIDLIELKGVGIMDLLDEEGKLPKSSDDHFTSAVHNKHGKHFRLALPRKSPLQAHRNLKDDQGFIIRHFAGAVCYQTASFLEKNDDALHGSLEALVHESKDPFVRNLFPAGRVQSSKKLAFASVGNKFKTQLNQLMEKLKSTGSNFIRCIKPNDKMRSKDFEGGQILSQLQCAGMVSVLELMQDGYPSRALFSSLYQKYKQYLPPKLAALSPRTFCQALFRAIGIGSDDFKFGMSKVFFRPGKLEARSLSCKELEARSLSCKELEARSLSCKELEAIRLSCKELEARRLSCKELEARSLSCKELEARSLSCKELEARRLSCKELEARSLSCKELEARSLSCKELEAIRLSCKELEARRLSCKELEARSLSCKELDARSLSCKELEARSLSCKELEFAEFDQLMKSDPETLNALVAKVQRWIICNRWKKSIWGAISVQKLANKIKYRRERIVRIQKTVRMFLAIAKHKPRYQGIMKVRRLHPLSMEINQLAASLKKDKEIALKQCKDLETAIDDLVKKIKTSLLKQEQIDNGYNDLFSRLTNQMNDMKKRLKAQKEEERIRKMQEQMELERKKKEEEERIRREEERRKKEEEEERRRKAELEARLRKEAEELERQRLAEEEASRQLLEKLKAEQEAAEKARKAQEEQEKRDYDLALRLSTESQTSLKVKEPTQVVVVEEEQTKKSPKVNKNTDLRSLKYDELRNIINTSTDVELLAACRSEFHRRLKVYHDWRKKNTQNKAGKSADQRAPVDVIKNAETTSSAKTQQQQQQQQAQKQPPPKKSANEAARAQRFFRVSFARPTDQYRNSEYKKTGWWYAHFDGEWVARQLEIHPNGVLLLVAGRDDLDMCELSLTQTGLAKRPGAEINRADFENEWTKHGGTVSNVVAKQRK